MPIIVEELFHKSAKKDWRNELRRSGVLSSEYFSDHSELRAFSPGEGLARVISHYWILRWDLPEGLVYRPMEALFPHANSEFRRRLLAIPEDSALAAELDAFFRGIRIENSLHGSAVQSILQSIGVRRDLRSVPAVSRAFGIPERTLQHIFRDEVGASLRWILLRARLLDAVAESFDLEQPDWAGIAYKHGYSSQAHFITDFKRVFGVTPEGYRRSDTGRIPGKA